MSIRFRKPKLVPLVATLTAVLVTFSLGEWQVRRLEWKTALLERIEAAQSEAPRDLLDYKPAELPQAEWRSVRATGSFLYDRELYAAPRYLRERLGYAIFTPLKVESPSGPAYVLVNRGWVSPEHKEPDVRRAGNPPENLTVEGVIRLPGRRGIYVPENRPDQNLWFWYDLPAMAKSVRLPLLPIYLDATGTRTASGLPLRFGPEPFPVEVTIRNDHLGYAVTWFLIGIAAILMFAYAHWERPTQKLSP